MGIDLSQYRKDSLIEEPFYAMDGVAIGFILSNDGLLKAWRRQAELLNPMLSQERFETFAYFLLRNFSVLDCFFAIDFGNARFPDVVSYTDPRAPLVTKWPIMLTDEGERTETMKRVATYRRYLHEVFKGFEGYDSICSEAIRRGVKATEINSLIIEDFGKAWRGDDDIGNAERIVRQYTTPVASKSFFAKLFGK